MYSKPKGLLSPLPFDMYAAQASAQSPQMQMMQAPTLGPELYAASAAQAFPMPMQAGYAQQALHPSEAAQSLPMTMFAQQGGEPAIDPNPARERQIRSAPINEDFLRQLLEQFQSQPRRMQRPMTF